MTYTMHIETGAGVKNHPFHLGTDKRVAVGFCLEQVRLGAKSVALRLNGKIERIYDFRDLRLGDILETGKENSGD